MVNLSHGFFLEILVGHLFKNPSKSGRKWGLVQGLLLSTALGSTCLDGAIPASQRQDIVPWLLGGTTMAACIPLKVSCEKKATKLGEWFIFPPFFLLNQDSHQTCLTTSVHHWFQKVIYLRELAGPGWMSDDLHQLSRLAGQRSIARFGNMEKSFRDFHPQKKP